MSAPVCVYLGVCVNLSAICLVCGLYHFFGWGGKGVSWVRNSVLRKCACGDTQFQFMNVNIYVLISNNATSEILMKYKQNVSEHHTPQIQSYARTLTQISSPTHTQRESSAHAGKHRHS